MTKLASLLAAGTVMVCAGAFAQMADSSHQDHKPPTTQATTQPANTKCPVGGEDVDPSITVTQDGKTVAFCCKDCVAEFKKNPDKYMKKLK